MTQDTLKQLLKAPTPPYGVIILTGEEQYLIRRTLDNIRKRMVGDPTFATFNHLLFEGADVDFARLTDALHTPPMFSDCKLIEWHMAHLNDFKDEELASLAALTEEANAQKDTLILLLPRDGDFDPGTAKRPSPLYKKLEKAAEIILFEKSTDPQLIAWLHRHFAHEGVRANEDVPRAMLTRCGHSMDVLANETEKLASYCKANGIALITKEWVEVVCAPTTESDAFGLTNALMQKDAKGAYRYLADMKATRCDPTLVLGTLARYTSDLLQVALLSEEGLSPAQIASVMAQNEYKISLYQRSAQRRTIPQLRRAMSLCQEADKKAKRSFSADLYPLLDALVATLLQL